MADPPEAVPAGPPTCPFHPTFLSRSAPASDLAVIKVGEQCMLFFVGSVHQLEVCKGDNADAESEIHFAMSGEVVLQPRPWVFQYKVVLERQRDVVSQA